MKNNLHENSKMKSWFEKFDLQSIDIQILSMAFTHPSYKGMFPEAEDYERLEFLGDAVLDLVVAEKLYIRESGATEGKLTEQRAQLVNNNNLALAFEELEMRKFIKTARDYILSEKDKANVVEAVFGAYFLSSGYDYCEKLWQTIEKKIGNLGLPIQQERNSPEGNRSLDRLSSFGKDLSLIIENPKGLLQEICQKQGLPIPSYEVIQSKGPDHNPTFTVQVSCSILHNRKQIPLKAVGIAGSKKKAELAAARTLCQKMGLNKKTL